jgi:hypothetical protein
MYLFPTVLGIGDPCSKQSDVSIDAGSREMPMVAGRQLHHEPTVLLQSVLSIHQVSKT